MKVAIDATPLTVPTGGIRRYTSELIEALRLEFPEDRFEPLRERPSNFLTRRWWLAGLPLELARGGFDLFHGTDFAVPYLPVRPSVLTLHDLSPWKKEPWRAPSARVERRTPYLIRLGLPTMIVTPTQAVRREAMAMFGMHPSRIAAVPLAAAPLMRPVAVAPEPEPYFLCLGVIEPRKNIPMVMEAWRASRPESGAELVVAGRVRFDAPPVAPEPGLRLPGALEEDRLPALYSGALALLYPSFYEGFGLPLLEAMQCGCPVVASNAGALREVSGGAALHLDANDPQAWAEAMRSLAASPGLREQMREDGLQRAAQFSWARTARLTREVYEEARRMF